MWGNRGLREVGSEGRRGSPRPAAFHSSVKYSQGAGFENKHIQWSVAAQIVIIYSIFSVRIYCFKNPKKPTLKQRAAKLNY